MIALEDTRVRWSAVAHLHKQVMAGLLLVAVGAWGQSIAVKLPILQHKAEVELPRASATIKGKSQLIRAQGKELKKKSADEIFCKKLFGELPL